MVLCSRRENGDVRSYIWRLNQELSLAYEGPHFRDLSLLLDEQADQIFAMTDPIAERVRKLGAATMKSIGQIARTQRLLGNDAE